MIARSGFSFENKVVVVTGSGKGIGAETVRYFFERGAKVVVNDIDGDVAKKTAKELDSSLDRVWVSSHDVSAREQAEKLVAGTREKFGRLDVLVNNAGILRDAMLMKLEEKQWDDVLRVNLKGPFNMGQACAPVFKEQKYGKILNLASIAWLGNVGQSNYSAAKAGVVGLTRTWALELARYNVNVNAIAPGLVETEMTAGIPDEIKERFFKAIPLGRMAKVEEVAHLIGFLVSDEAAYITGQCLSIDGGLTTGIRV